MKLSALGFVGLVVGALAGPAAAQMTCTPDPAGGMQTCQARLPIGDYLIDAKACDAAGNCAIVQQTVVPLAQKLEVRQEGTEFVFTWRLQPGMTPTFTATPR